MLLILLGVLVVHGAEGASTHAGSLRGAATAAAQVHDGHRTQLVASPGDAADLAASAVAGAEPDHGSEHSQDLGCFAVVAPTSAPSDVDATTPSLTTLAGTERDSYTGPSPSGPGSPPPPCRALSLFELSVLRV